jgi:hypothetical protein
MIWATKALMASFQLRATTRPKAVTSSPT